MFIHLRLSSGNNSVTRDQLGENSTSGLNTEGKGTDVNKDDIGSSFSAREDTTLDSSTICDSLIRVDSLGGFLATKVFLEELLDLGNASGTTNKDDLSEYMRLVSALVANKVGIYLVDVLLLDVGVLQDLLDRFHGLPEEVHVKFFELGASKGLREVIAIFEALDFDASALLARQGPLGLLNLTLEFTKSAEVLADVGACLLLV